MFGWLRAAAASFSHQTVGAWMDNAPTVTTPISRGLFMVSNWLDKYRWMIESSFLNLSQHGYHRNSIVYACLSLLGQAVAEPPLKIYTGDVDAKTGERVGLDRNHPLSKLIRRPNSLMTEYEFWEATTINLNIRGHAFWYKERDSTGQIVALWPLRPDRVGPVYSTSQDPKARVIYGWSYLVPGTSYIIDMDKADVLAFNLYDPAGESGGVVEGLGPLQVLATEIAADNEATQFVGSVLHNAAVTTVALQVKLPLPNQQQADLIKQRFMSQFGGMRRGEPIVLDAETEIKQLGFNLQQLEFTLVRRNAETRVSAAFGVPAILAGLSAGLERSTFANISEARAFFAETTCSGFWRRFADQYQMQIVDEFDEDLVAEFDVTKVRALATQRAVHVAPFAEAWTRGAITKNEYRRELGMVSVPEGDVYLMTTTETTVTTSGEVAVSGAPPPPEPAANGANPAANPSAKQLAGKAVVSPIRARLTAPDRSAEEKRLQKRLDGIFATYQTRLVDRLTATQPGTQSATRSATRAAGDPDEDAADGFDDDQFTADLADALTDELGDSHTSETARLVATYGVSRDPAESANDAQVWASQSAPPTAQKLTDATRPIVDRAIAAYQTGGLTLGDLTARLAPVFGPTRAKLIAITETTRAAAAAMTAYQTQLATAGVDLDQVWHTNEDDLVCPICDALDELPASEWPPEQTDGPPGHPGCRCFLTLAPPVAAKGLHRRAA